MMELSDFGSLYVSCFLVRYTAKMRADVKILVRVMTDIFKLVLVVRN